MRSGKIGQAAVTFSQVSPEGSPDRSTLTHKELLEHYSTVRAMTEQICDPLKTEDFVIQSMQDASPARWHLAHATWFFERFILREQIPAYQPVHPQYEYLFNSYYNTVGPQHCRPRRGLVSRPTVEQIFAYRHKVDDLISKLIDRANQIQLQHLYPLVELGLNHEQQHQELMLTDIKHAFSVNPLLPIYKTRTPITGKPTSPTKWISFEGGVYEIGHTSDDFYFDNERPRHKVFLDPFKIGSRLITNAQFMQFIEDGGYQTPRLWLSLGWTTIQEQNWKQPLYWYRDNDQWFQFTLHGPQPIDLDEPVCHVSYFEADAFARWAGARLPTEAQWEIAVASSPLSGNLLESRRFHPDPSAARMPANRPQQCFGDVWEWTASPYSPYPGYTPPAGAIGEYNGKFMCNQFVLRGGSCVTPRTHLRSTYRNFFPPNARWQFSGLRLAQDT